MPKGKGKSSVRRFGIQEGSTKKELRGVLAKMEVERYDIHEFMNQSCRIAFVRDGREYQFICDEFNNYPDNLRAAERGIHLLWLIFEDYMVRTADVPVDFGVIFMGFAVTEGQKILAITDGQKACWDVMGLPKDSTAQEINKRYRELAKTSHPDNGGDAVEFKRLTQAMEEVLEMKVR